VNDKPYAHYCRDPQDYLTFDRLFCWPLGQDPGQDDAYGQFRNELHVNVLRQNFSRTLFLLERAAPWLLAAYLLECPLRKNRLEVFTVFAAYLENVLDQVTPPQRDVIKDAFAFENKLLDRERLAAVMPEPLERRLNRLKQETGSLDNACFLDGQLVVSPGVEIGTTRWNWSLNARNEWEENLRKEPAGHPYLINSYNCVVSGDHVQWATYHMLAAFTAARPGRTLVQDWLPEAGTGPARDELVRQIRTAFDGNLLITPAMREALLAQQTSVELCA
jgi:hypothetical protein